MEIIDTFQQLLDPNWIMENGGLYLVLVILFIEVAFFFGFFLPGDPLLFVAGMVIGVTNEAAYPFANDLSNLTFWILLFIGATLIGYQVGYWCGNKFGPVLRKKKDNWIFKQKYIDSAQEFYNKKGGFAIAISRFLPIVRTFAPLIGGMVKMDKKKFFFYNVIGAIIWVSSITTLGYVLGDNPWVKANLEIVIIGLVVLVTAPVVLKSMTAKKA